MTADEVLGRRIRPWWGKSPYRLITQGAFQGVVAGLVIYASMQVRNGALDVGAFGMEPARAERIALIAALLAGVFFLYCLARVVVGLVDLVLRHTVEGTVIGVAERQYGDVLPPILQHLIWSRGTDENGYSREDRRRTRVQLTLHTKAGVRSWTVRQRIANRVAEGDRVRLTVSPLIGYVRDVS